MKAVKTLTVVFCLMPAATALALAPTHGTMFELESLQGVSIAFKDTEVVIYTPDGVSIFKKK
jgi:hypothetical protein